MNYTIARILKETIVMGKSGQQTRTAFTTNETGETVFSAFSDAPLKQGQTIEGEVKEVEKDGRTFHNFNFTRKTPTTAMNLEPVIIELKRIFTEVFATRQEVVMVRQLLQEKGVLPTPPAPDNTTTAFDDFDIAPEDIPFN